MKYKVLISAPYFLPVVEKYREFFEQKNIEIISVPVNERLEEMDLLAIINDIDGVVCGDDRFTEAVLRRANRLKVISKWGTGIDSIDQKAAKILNIRVCNTVNAFTAPVSDSVIGYILAFARRIPEMSLAMQKGRWEKISGRALGECTLGVIGVGNIGQAVLRKAKTFGMRLLGNDTKEVPVDFINEVGVEICDKKKIFEQSDFISLNTDLTPTSYHLVSTSEFDQMKNTTYLINTSRGPVVDENALIFALENNKIAGAGLDVFEDEPLSLASPLRKFPNCLLAPHNSNSSPSAWEKVHENTIKNLLDGLFNTRK